jgi:hypothetical protein
MGCHQPNPTTRFTPRAAHAGRALRADTARMRPYEAKGAASVANHGCLWAARDRYAQGLPGPIAIIIRAFRLPNNQDMMGTARCAQRPNVC